MAKVNQPHNMPWILMMEKFPVETQHAFMFMPSNKVWPGAAAGSLEMNNRSIRHKNNFPVLLFESHAPIQVLAMQEILFIPRADIVDGSRRTSINAPDMASTSIGVWGKGCLSR
jgi:hypothetical protein